MASKTTPCIVVLLVLIIRPSNGVLKTEKLDDVANLTKLINVHRIRRLVKTMTSLAPRPVGSKQNEQLTVQFFMEQLQNIMKVAHSKSHHFHIEIQKAKGSLTVVRMQSVSSFTSVYDDIQNIIVTIGPSSKLTKNNSLLINAHFDTNPASLEASDSAANCVVMLETLRVLAHRQFQLEGFVVFLFNGASKTGLQGVHAFMTQYRGAAHVKAFIDLQSLGASGQQLLYEAGPDHAWQVSAYSTAANNPFGSIIAQELYYCGLVSSETDYRVLRDYGHIPGIGLAYIKNGYVYDTVYDTDDLLSDKDLTYSAETLYNIVSYILRSPYLMHPLDLRNGKIVYFDMFGLFIVAYSQDRAFVINECIAILVILELIFKIKKARHEEGAKSKEVTKRLVTASCCLIGCWGATIGLNVLLGFIMGVSGFGLTWYRNPYWIIGLYICPAISFLIAFNALASWRWQKSYRLESLWEVECVFFDATRMVWAILLLALTRATIKSAFLLTSWLLFPTLLRSLPAYLCVRKNVRYYSVKMVCLYFASLLIPMAMTLYMSQLIYVIIVPVLGRAGATINSDVTIALVSALIVILCVSYLTTLIHLAAQHAWKFITLFLVVFAITIIIILSSNLGFPYTVDSKYPVPQKYIIQHVHRNDSEKSSSGFWIIPLDYNGPYNLFKEIPDLEKVQAIADDCDNKVFCGMPMYMPDFSMYKNTYFLETPEIADANSTGSNLLISPTRCRRELMNPFITRIYFMISGPDHMSAHLKIKPDMLLVRWSMDAFIPDPPQTIGASPIFFIFYSRGGGGKRKQQNYNNDGSWYFWIEINHPEDNATDLVEVFIARHHMHGPLSHSDKFNEFLSSFPDWTHVTSWTSTYDKFAIEDNC